jgi:predicted secreted protein
MTQAISGFGSKLNWDGADIAELTNISGPTQSVETIDVTSHDSADAYREFIAALLSGGDISLEGNFISGDTTGQIAMHTDFQARTVKNWIIKFPEWITSSHEYPQLSGAGLVTAFEFTFPSDNKIGFTATIKVSGKPTLALA